MITRNYFMSVIHHRSDRTQCCTHAIMAITSFFPKKINLVATDLAESLKKIADKNSPTQDINAHMQIIAFNRI